MIQRCLPALVLLPVVALCQTRTHLVRPGETVEAIADRYGVTVDQVISSNGLGSRTLPIGEIIVVPTATASAPNDQVTVTPVATAEPVDMTIRAAEPVVVAAPIGEELFEDPAPVAEESVVDIPQVPPPPRATSSFAEAIRLPSGTRYNGKWKPPGESSAWVMDCSNTARWLAREVGGVDLPRTASSQYEWLRQRRRLWRSRPDSRSLQKKLRPGDLLFWENTYKPVRKPPITHVMTYLGVDESGRMKMAGSQGSRGVGIYTFDPNQSMGGYRFFFFFRKEGRFVAFGRPAE